MTDERKAMTIMMEKYKNDAKDAVDEMMSRIVDLDIDDWHEYQKHGIDF